MTKELVHLVLKIYPLCQCRAFLSHHLLKVSSLLKKLVSCKKRVICAMLQSSQEIHNTDVDFVKNVVCNLFCSIQDPTSDNQMHRIHKPGHWICQQIQGGFDCPYCEKKVSSQRNLDDHISENHEHQHIRLLHC